MLIRRIEILMPYAYFAFDQGVGIDNTAAVLEIWKIRYVGLAATYRILHCNALYAN
jgi:hypothetical protein